MLEVVLSGRIEAAEKPAKNIPAMSLVDLVLNSLENDKAEDVVAIDIKGKSAMADHIVVASGRSTRQVAALSEKLAERVKEAFGIVAKSEGKSAADWVLLDLGDVIVHIFRPEVREFYQIEKLWQAELGAQQA
ncbi:MAG: ribosome silencing factor [Pseudomonadota bacterium]